MLRNDDDVDIGQVYSHKTAVPRLYVAVTDVITNLSSTEISFKVYESLDWDKAPSIRLSEYEFLEDYFYIGRIERNIIKTLRTAVVDRLASK